jgi:hypothetical protein
MSAVIENPPVLALPPNNLKHQIESVIPAPHLSGGFGLPLGMLSKKYAPFYSCVTNLQNF